MSYEPLNGHLYTTPSQIPQDIFTQLVHEEYDISLIYCRILSQKFRDTNY